MEQKDITRITVPETFKQKAAEFLNPEIFKRKDVYSEFCMLVDKKFNKLQCVVLYDLSEAFHSFLKKNEIEIEKKEVIITNGTLMALDTYEVKNSKLLIEGLKFAKFQKNSTSETFNTSYLN